MMGESHIRRVKRNKTTEFVRSCDLHHYVILSLFKEKPDIVIYVGLSNRTHEPLKIFTQLNWQIK